MQYRSFSSIIYHVVLLSLFGSLGSAVLAAEGTHNVFQLLRLREMHYGVGPFSGQRELEAASVALWAKQLQEKRQALSRGDVLKNASEGDLAYREQLKTHLSQVFSRQWREEARQWLDDHQAQDETLNLGAAYLAAGLTRAKLSLDLPLKSAALHGRSDEVTQSDSLLSRHCARQSISLAIIFAASDAESCQPKSFADSCFKHLSGLVTFAQTLRHPVEAFYEILTQVLSMHEYPPVWDDISSFRRNIEGLQAFQELPRTAMTGIGVEQLAALTKYSSTPSAELEMAEILALLWLVDEGKPVIRSLIDQSYRQLETMVPPHFTVAMLKKEIGDAIKAYTHMPLHTHLAGRRALRRQYINGQPSALAENEQRQSMLSRSALHLQALQSDWDDFEKALALHLDH